MSDRYAHMRTFVLRQSLELFYCNGHDSQDPLKGSKGVGCWKGIDFTDFSNQTQE